MIEDAEMPAIRKSNELLIQVKAASLSITDTKICFGYSKIYRRLLNSGVSILPPKILPIRLITFHLYRYNMHEYERMLHVSRNRKNYL